MSRLDELIAKFCPNGVKYRELKDILIIKNGKDYKNLTEGKYPVYGSGGIMTYVSSYVYDKPSVLIPRKGSIDKLYYVEEPFWNVDTIFYTEIDEEKVIPRYVYFCLQKEHLEQYNTAGGVPSLTQKVLNRVKLPVPPLEVQREIVHILDSFTLLTAELTAELTARRKQYEFYRNKLLSQNKKYAMKPLSELGEWSGGKTPSTAERKFWEDGVIPWISSKDMKVSTLEDTQNHITQKAVKEASMKVYPPNSIAIVTRSGILKHTFPVAYVPFETTVNQDIKILVVNHEILPRYAFHVIQGKGKDILLKTKKQGGTVDSLDFQKVLAYKVPVPPKDIQKRLVKVLDNFESICNDLNIGLPAEIKARQKQYEYYRDLLLTFAEKGNTIVTDRQTDRHTDRQTDRQTELNVIKLLQYVFGYAVVKLDDIVDFRNGKGHEKNIIDNGKYIVVNSKFVSTNGEVKKYSDQQICPLYKNDILMVMSDLPNGRALAKCYLVEENDKYTLNQRIGAFTVNRTHLISTKYLYYVLNRNRQLLRYDNGADQTNLRKNDILNISIAIPTIEEQQKITDILDRFDSICNDLSIGLPAEIEARKKQYEYYRDKLLTFKELQK